uniref:PH domain-containing protein n=1 Tax=Macrostomum lignano TaxID=282301 RepID=A0A1I8JRP4_9PLAT
RSRHSQSAWSAADTNEMEDDSESAESLAGIGHWLSVKHWLVHKRRRVEPAPHRKWRPYWASLRGTVLMLHKSDSAAASSLSLALPHVAASASCAGDYPEGNATGVVAGTSMELSHPRLCLIVEGCIAQAMPEHPKREHVLSLSTAFGDAYLLQATSKEEMDAWVAAFHTACASLFARQRGKVDTVRLLRSEIAKLECSVDLDGKMRTMAELQLSAVRDTRSRQTITRDIEQWKRMSSA